jgi:ATP-dependent Clp protease adaptor protein ClpS
MSNTDTLEKVVIDEKIEREVKEPGKYHVIFLNDNHTPMDFVIELLMQIFKHDAETAQDIMFKVHEEGKAIAGTYFYEIAEQKTTEATNIARQQGFPLGIHVEKAE